MPAGCAGPARSASASCAPASTASPSTGASRQRRARCARRLLHAPHYTLPLGWTGPSVVTIHDLTHVRFPQFFPPGAALYARAMAGMAARRARVVLADSEFGRREVIELLGVPDSKVRAIPLGISPAFAPAGPDEVAAFRAARGLPADYVLYVGARRGHKNLALLLQAWRALGASARPPLVLSGERWSADEPLAREAAALGVDGSIHFAGETRDEATLRSLYAGAALYVQPSLSEGFGLPPLEAMACGTPVLSSDAGSLREVLGEAAELLPPRDPEAWASAITALLGDAARRAALVARGRTRAARYTWESTAQLTRAAWGEALRA